MMRPIVFKRTVQGRETLRRLFLKKQLGFIPNMSYVFLYPALTKCFTQTDIAVSTAFFEGPSRCLKNFLEFPMLTPFCLFLLRRCYLLLKACQGFHPSIYCKGLLPVPPVRSPYLTFLRGEHSLSPFQKGLTND